MALNLLLIEKRPDSADMDQLSLRHGIENLLKHFCPDVQEVRPV